MELPQLIRKFRIEMKKIFLVILAFGSLAACKKNKVTPTVNIVGKWELHRRYGGNINPPDTTFQAGNGTILQFNADSTYKSYNQGTLIGSGTFRILRNAYKMDGQVYDELYFINNTDYTMEFPDIVRMSGNMLTITPVIPDAATLEYSKLSN